MALRWIPRFVYGPAPTTLDLALPVGLWRHLSTSAGQTRQTATGAPGASILRRGECLVVPVRLFESEWPAVRALIEWGQTKAPFDWYPDSDPLNQDQMIAARVTLIAPRVGEPIAPEPDPVYPRVLSIDLTFRQIGETGAS